MSAQYVIGLDYGTNSVRTLIVSAGIDTYRAFVGGIGTPFVRKDVRRLGIPA